VQMGRHDDKRVCPQAFVLVAEVQSFADDFACRFRNEHGQPFDHREGDEEEGAIGVEARSMGAQDKPAVRWVAKELFV
jgi:hypothetical protein